MNILGKGGFGIVERDKDDKTIAIKTLRNINDLIQEFSLLVYFSQSNYILNCKGFKLDSIKIYTEVWENGSLRSLFDSKKEIKNEMKHIIFRDVLIGLCHMRQSGILHSDVKSSNILVDIKNKKACLCDLGLSSLISYAKVFQTADPYRPEEPLNVAGHDVYGLCISMMELFGGVRPRRKRTPKEMREEIKKMPVESKIKSILLKMACDTPDKSPDVNYILGYVYKLKTVFSKPNVVIYEDKIDEDHKKYICDEVISIAKFYSIKRELRCYQCLINHFNSNLYKETYNEYPLYIVSSMIYFSSLFGKPSFTVDTAYKACSEVYTRTQIKETLIKLLANFNFIYQSLDAHIENK